MTRADSQGVEELVFSSFSSKCIMNYVQISIATSLTKRLARKAYLNPMVGIASELFHQRPQLLISQSVFCEEV